MIVFLPIIGGLVFTVGIRLFRFMYLTLRRSLFLTPPPTPPRIRGGEQADSCLRPALNSGEGGERSERGGGQTDTLRKMSYV